MSEKQSLGWQKLVDGYPSDKYIAGAGISITRRRWDLHCSYYAVFSADVHVRRNRDGFNGTYETYTSLASVSLDYRF